jgi:hypothetical protein
LKALSRFDLDYGVIWMLFGQLFSVAVGVQESPRYAQPATMESSRDGSFQLDMKTREECMSVQMTWIFRVTSHIVVILGLSWP